MFLPIGHDQTVRRLPYVTLGIMVVCTLLQILRSILAPSEAELSAAAKRVVEVEKRIMMAQWSGLPNQRPPSAFDDQYSDEPAAPPTAPSTGVPEVPSAVAPAIPDAPMNPSDIVRDFEAGKIGAANDPLREELRAAKAAFEELRLRDPVQRFGYRASAPFSFNVLLAAFVHAGWLHLIGNMLFLWLCGMNMEDRWGHAVFAGFYALAAIVASVTWATVNRGTSLPAVGASGAIAGAMGAFLVDYHHARLKVLYWVWWRMSFKPGVFFVRALFALPVWFGGQLLDAWIESDPRVASGTAYSAHVGGFLFGFAFALAMRLSGADARLALAEDEGLDEGAQEEAALARARATAEQDPAAAIGELRTMLVKHPDRIRARRLLLELALSRGDASAIATSASAVLAHLGENAEWHALARTFLEIEQIAPRTALTDRALAMATRAGVCVHDLDAALAAARRLVDAFPTSPLLRGTLWDLDALQLEARREVLSKDTLRRIHAAPPAVA